MEKVDGMCWKIENEPFICQITCSFKVLKKGLYSNYKGIELFSDYLKTSGFMNEGSNNGNSFNLISTHSTKFSDNNQITFIFKNNHPLLFYKIVCLKNKDNLDYAVLKHLNFGFSK